MSTIKQLKLSKGTLKLNIEDWELPAVGLTALVGASGSGKTTCLKVMLGLESASSFQWFWSESGESFDISKLSFKQKRFGVVFQETALFPHMTTFENIIFSAEARGLDKRVAKSQALEFLNRLGLESCGAKKAKVLSGGEAQRVALLRAIIGSPRFLFLDEPFSALDSHSKQAVRKLVKEMVTEFKIPTLMITHDKGDVAELADAQFELKEGRLNEI